MDVAISLNYCTADCFDAVGQAVEAFNEALAAEALEVTAQSAVRHLAIGLQIENPLRNGDNHQQRGRFDLSTGTYFGSASLDYADWIEPSWQKRITALAAASLSALGSTSRMRLAADVRTEIVAAIERAAVRATRTPPPALTELAPVYLMFTGDGGSPSVAFTKPLHASAGTSHLFEVLPEAAAETAARHFPAAADVPTMFKLYRRDGATLVYREAWPDGESIIEHWGTCGERGSSLRHDAVDEATKRSVLAGLRATAEQDGYQVIAIADHGTIVAQRPTVEARWEADLELRYELQEALNQTLGWTGLGYCDGGSTGGGSMEVFCHVVDINAGLAVVNRQLADPRFRGFVATTSR